MQDGSSFLVYSGIEGADVTVECSFPSSFIRKFFCKETFRQVDILIETTNATDYQSGRYRIVHKQGGYLVTISQLTKSDSRGYCCGAGSNFHRLQTRKLKSSLWMQNLLVVLLQKKQSMLELEKIL
ncbi:hypothetical protein F7725_001195 [Dissostichus mawsoni]|uniref:Immunoglobulin V-set domain-containing protein n=1 Tax=Dissostichus mawsoni TaxID=36200 RepID=A0A7J5ZH16_DISMA|nr:hypothetical protein F7725_001195 [Dissostichus mawsoni]